MPVTPNLPSLSPDDEWGLTVNTAIMDIATAANELETAIADLDVGQAGRSAYQLAVDAGFVGTEAAWLASLNGAPGAPGAPGAKGDTGASLVIQGTVTDLSDLPPTGDQGDAYLLDGDLITWDGDEWVNVGKIQGPAGDPGPAYLAPGGPVAVGMPAVMRGINSSGGEFTPANVPGVYDTDYHYDGAASMAFLAARGARMIRLPFRWERIQHTLGGPLDAAELGRLVATVNHAAAAGMWTVLDLHNYGRYGASVLGDGTLTGAHLVDVWEKLAATFDLHPGVVAYGLMNEPHDFAGASVEASTVNDFDDDTQGWVVDGGTATLARDTAQKRSGAGSLRANATMAAGSNVNVRLGNNQGGSLNNYVPGGGSALSAWVLIPEGSPGTNHQARIDVQNSSYTYRQGNLTALTPGVWTEVKVTPPPGELSNARQIIVQVSGDFASSSSLTVYVDDINAVDIESGAALWETISQELVDALREGGSTKTLMVPGYDWSGIAQWTDTHEEPWISDPLNNFRYEGHHYWDRDHNGFYTHSYADEVDESSNDYGAGDGDELHSRVLQELDDWLEWLDDYNVQGFVGEFGWPNNADQAQWNQLAQAWFKRADAARLWTTVWAAGEWWGDYYLSVYESTDGVLAYPKSSANVVEAHLVVADPVLPAGGGSGQVLAKTSSDDFAFEWVDPPSGGGDTYVTQQVTQNAGNVVRVGGLEMVAAFDVPEAQFVAWKAAGGTHVVVQAIWDQLEPTQGELDSAALDDLLERMIEARNNGLQVIFEFALQYAPAWYLAAAPKYRDQYGATWDSTDPGDQVRDMVWSNYAWSAAKAFMTLLWPWVRSTHNADGIIDSIRVGFGIRGEMQMPPVGPGDGAGHYQWWAFSTAARGTDTAPDQNPMPLTDGYNPHSGGGSDEAFVSWYQASIAQRVSSFVYFVRNELGWADKIHVMHPNWGVRPGETSDSWSWRAQQAAGCDWSSQIDQYRWADKVYPWSTWLDQTPFSVAGSANPVEWEPWRYLAYLAYQAGLGDHLWGENTGGHQNADMDAMFREGSLAGSYRGVAWLNWGQLTDGSHATLANLTARLGEARRGGPIVTGARADGTALDSLLRALDARGLVTNQSVAGAGGGAGADVVVSGTPPQAPPIGLVWVTP